MYYGIGHPFGRSEYGFYAVAVEGNSSKRLLKDGSWDDKVVNSTDTATFDKSISFKTSREAIGALKAKVKGLVRVPPNYPDRVDIIAFVDS